MLQRSLLALTILLMAGISSAEPLNAFGMDIVRLIDSGQFEPEEGTINLMYQRNLGNQNAINTSIAWGDDSNIIEAGYRRYNKGYFNSSFWQLGVAHIDVDNSSDYSNEVAALAIVGIEHMPVENVIFTSAVKVYMGVDHPKTGESDPVFAPSMGVMVRF